MRKFDLSVEKDAFLNAIKRCALFDKGKNPAMLLLFVKNAHLIMEMGGMTQEVPCEGSFVGTAYLSGTIAKRFNKQLLPEGDRVDIKALEGKIMIGDIIYACEWVGIRHQSEITIPINMTFADYLYLGYKYSDEEIKSAGLMPKYEAALQRKASLIHKAVIILSEFGISISDIEKLVDDSIRIKR